MAKIHLFGFNLAKSSGFSTIGILSAWGNVQNVKNNLMTHI